MVLTCRHNLQFAAITTGVYHFFTSTDDFTGHRYNMSGQTIQLNEHMTEEGNV